MQRELIVKGRSLGGSSDLTLLAPIKPGFVESLESVSYKTRIKRVLDTLHGARMAAHEHHSARLLSDAVERVAAIHSVRVAVLEPEDKVLLAVTFDGSWQAYIRVLWEKVGTLLDLIFCGTIDYVTAREHSFDEWVAWARRVQVETGFFYGPAENSARDLLYYRRVERMRTSGGARPPSRGDLDQLRTVLPDAEEAVLRTVEAPSELEPDDPQIRPVRAPRMVRERIRNGLEGLAALYRLTDLHRPGTPDGDVLRHAAIDLLAEFARMRDRLLIDRELEEQKARFERQLDWLFPVDRVPVLRKPVLQRVPDTFAVPAEVRADVQAGVLRSYPKVTHGALVLLAFDGAAAVGRFLDQLTSAQGRWPLTTDRDIDPDQAAPDRVYRSLGFTLAGLRAAGLDEDRLELFPEEFRQGMAARAGLLGDVRHNHPRRWRLPRRFNGAARAAGPETIEIDTVHAVLQLRCLADEKDARAAAAYELHDAGHPLQAEVDALAGFGFGVRVLAVQPMRRNFRDGDGRGEVIAEHFGYADGDGQPEPEWQRDPHSLKRNRILLGELLHGHPNAADEPRDPAARLHWLGNGSFLVLRKYRQFVGRFRAAVDRAAGQMAAQLGLPVPECTELAYGKLMGRRRNGLPLIPIADKDGKVVTTPTPDTALNVFTYDLDPRGEQCPLHAHVRRAHPRQRIGESSRPPRLMRRSMAYGPALPEGADDDESVERGLCFMAYNANLGEQFEVVQRWLVGGNSSGSSSGVSCPIVGVPENGLERHVQFEAPDNDGQPRVIDVQLENGTRLFDPPPVSTQLEWGLYLFAPSMTVLGRLRDLAHATARAQPPAPWQVSRGRLLITRLRSLEAGPCPHAAVEGWKNALEDPESIDRLDSASIWAAIRADHGGVLRTPFGVLVASRELVAEVYLDSARRYSVCGQLERMRRSFGEIALGMDEGPVYRSLANPVNQAIGALTPEGSSAVFDLARAVAMHKVEDIVAAARAQSTEAGDPRFEVGFDVREVLDEVLAALSEDWFGIADQRKDSAARFRKGATDWDWKRGEPPLYPGHFTALSRYMFQPNPGPTVIELGQSYGQALRESMRQFVEDHRRARSIPRQRDRTPGPPDRFAGPAPIAAAIFRRWPDAADNDFVARTMVGVLMGFNPTIIGAVLNVLREWHREGRIGEMRLRLKGVDDYPAAKAALERPLDLAARMRPMPQLGWRTALTAHRLGGEGGLGVDIAAGDQVVLGIVSGTQQSLAEGGDDGRLMFGGQRELEPSPTHACPGYEAGMQAMLGTLTAVLGFADCDTVRPGPVPQSLVIEGPTQLPGAQAAVNPPAAAAGGGATRKSAPVAVPNSRGLVMAWGDSWLDYSYDEVLELGTDLRDCLERVGYRIPARYCKYSIWPKVETMAADPGGFCADLDSALLSPSRPVAILLSAGGNDSTGDALYRMLKDKDPKNPQASAVDEAELARHVERLREGYETVLTAIVAVLREHGAKTPILLHGYDNPIPAGKLGIKRWLREPFDRRLYHPTADMAVAKAAMRRVIEALNDMLKKLAAIHGATYVDLRGTIEQAQSTDPAVDWDNDLHPNSPAFELMARKLDTAIQAAISAAATVTAQP